MKSDSNNPIVNDNAEPDQQQPTALDLKVIDIFSGYVVRKDLTQNLKQNAVVPTYVLEYLLSQHCATDNPDSIKSGLEQVRRILAKHYVHRNESELVKSTIKEKGNHKVIDKLTVELNEKQGFYEAEFSNLGIKKVPVSDDFVRRFPKLLVGGIWSITDVNYEVPEDPRVSPWSIDTLKPIQSPRFDFAEFIDLRSKLTSEEWIDMLMQSIGFNPEMFSRRGKLLTLTRLVPYCERNYNLIELGPKGTGKSHIYAEFSPHGILISGAEVSVPKLFVNNSTGRIGLVGYWDSICFDEFAGKDKKVDKSIVDILKNYMANRSFSRGIEQLSAEASMVYMGNTKKSMPYMLKHSHFFDQLPDKYIDSAFIDRLHAFIPGWEVTPVRNELFTRGYGFTVDYMAEILKHQRSEDYTGAYKDQFEVVSELTTRDQTGFEKTFSGLMKILYPDGKANADEIKELLHFSMECRRRVREHMLRIDDTFSRHDFVFKPLGEGEPVTVLTPEEVQYPTFAGPRIVSRGNDDESQEDLVDGNIKQPSEIEGEDDTPKEEHVVVPENAKGWNYQRLFSKHLLGAKKIIVNDPYIRKFHQTRNMMEFLQMLNGLVEEGDEVEVSLVTSSDPESCVRQEEQLDLMVESFTGSNVSFSWKFNHNQNFHARSIETDHGWKITLDRGLDIFDIFDFGPFSLESGLQEARKTKGTEITFIRI